MGKNQHVVRSGGKWAVRGERNPKITSLHDTQREAIEKAREISRNQKSELIIHGVDGKIRAKDSHGHDPYPPRG